MLVPVQASCLVALLLLLLFGSGIHAQLSPGYYSSSCPNVESIIQQVMLQKFKITPNSVPGTLRLFFHDCFVDGCDASVLIASTASNSAEKDSEINLSLAGDGFDSVIKAKAAVEEKCPGIVSCADILAIATRDLVVLARGPSWTVRKGRKDGKISQASRVDGNLPKPEQSVDQLTKLFASKGLSQTDMVALSGAHTIGFAHCKEFMSRIYNFNSTHQFDPAMDPNFAKDLRLTCPQSVDPRVVANNDVTTPAKFDNVYYQNAVRGVTVLASDQILHSDARTRGLVTAYAGQQGAFFAAFATAMDNLGAVGVKTGNQGEIRKDCSRFNS
ncbi:hypothetical protein SELMODRAFT_125631 [Selaginella moellendorffii]|uniref:Peroxidase n=1 Tax=Selaginella moellendorffii TaxID=88036 RepID=D8SV50_SELML|nr:hypothetical protein SELMODRAFT_125631 [Selaginella moellendorffii]